MGAEKIIDDAVLDFEQRMSEEELDRFRRTTVSQVKEAILKIQHDGETFKSMRNLNRLRSFLDAMEQYTKVIEVFLNVNPMVGLIWGPIKFLLQVASSHMDSFDCLLDAYEKIGEELPLLEQYNDLFGHAADMRTALGYIFKDIADFHKRAIRFFTGNVWKKVFRAVWNDFNTRFNGILSNLRHHRNFIERQAQILHYQQSQQSSQELRMCMEEVRQCVGQYQKERMDALVKLESVERDTSWKKLREVLMWISASKAEQDHESFCNERRGYPETGRWILAHDKVQNWREEEVPESSILWVNGKPGAGKTILASVIIDACLKDRSFETCYFYCKDGDPQKTTCISVLKGLISQLLHHSLELVPHFHEKYLSSGDQTLSTPKLASSLLELLLETIPRVFMIIDGLDECELPERKQVLQILNKLVSQCDEKNPGKVRVLFVSQDFSDIAKSLPEAAKIVSLKTMHNEKDIRSYVRYWSGKIERKYELSSEEAEFIEDITCSRADGMFLFAKLVMLNLYDQVTRDDLINEIRESQFPKGLQDA